MQTRSVATINNILDTARKLFIEEQYADVTLRDITEAAGVTKGAVYHHFSTKEELYFQAMSKCLAEVKEALDTSLKDNQGEDCRTRLQRSLISFLQLPSVTRAIIQSLRRNINHVDEPLRTQLIQVYQAALPKTIEALLAEGMKNGEIVTMDARLLSWQHVAVVEASLYDYDRQMLGSAEEMAESIVSLFFDGISQHK